MNQSSTIAPVVVPPGAGPRFHAFGDEVIVHLSGEQTGGKFTLFTDITPPGGGPPPHYHVKTPAGEFSAPVAELHDDWWNSIARTMK